MVYLLKKIIYYAFLAYLIFVMISVFFGGGIVRTIAEKTGFEFFDNLADTGDSIKYKVDSLVGRVEKIKEEREEKGRKMGQKLRDYQKDKEDLLKGRD